jgi:hypothetical protein
MKNDLILRVALSFLIPFLMLFGFYNIFKYDNFRFYNFVLSFLYFIIVYTLIYLRKRKIGTKIVTVIFQLFLYFFILFLTFVLCILTNLRIPYIYDFISTI